MFWIQHIKSKEFKLLEELIKQLSMKIVILEIDASLLAEKLSRAVRLKAIKKTEEKTGEETEENKNPQILPI